MTCASCDGTGRWAFEDSDEVRACVTCGGSGEHRPTTPAKEVAAMAQNDAAQPAAWDRDEARRVAERLGMREQLTRDMGADILADDFVAAAALLRAADAEIARLRAREEAAEKVAEALRVNAAWWAGADMRPIEASKATDAALAAWDPSRSESER